MAPRLLLALSLLSSLTIIHAQTLNTTLLQLVRNRMTEGSTRSWEMGTHAQTLIEIDFPSISVFSEDYLSPTPPSAASLKPVLSIAKRAVDSMTGDQLVADGSAADPASLGVAVLLGNWTNAPGTNWARAAQIQLETLLARTPRSPTGAISHRKDEVQLWSDFVYMVPPFLAYYGAVTSNATLIAESVRQISLYRDALRDPSNANLWRHVVSGSWSDPGHWSTGNGWAAAGMLRVLATIKHSPFASQFKKEQSNLSAWISEIHWGMTTHQLQSGMFNNYVVDGAMNSGVTNFEDAAGTAAFASTVYQHVTLYKPAKYGAIIEAAEKARMALYANGGADHFDRNGWLEPVVNPDTFSQEGTQSPEGQCFLLQLDNNWNNWVKGGSANGAEGLAVTSRSSIAASFVTAVLIVVLTSPPLG